MIENIKISVIIPVYNSEKKIEKCLNSILEQTYKNYEIIVINDGSKDNSKYILSKYANEYPEIIKYIEQENMGVAKTRNRGIKLATGDYIAFIDNDDFIDNDYIKTFVNEIENGDYDVVLGGYRRPNEDGKIVKEMSLPNTEWGKFMIFAPWARIYKRQYLLDNDIEFLSANIGEDVYFNLQAMLISKKVKIIDYIGYNWFFNTSSVSNTIQKNIKNLEVYKLLDACYDTLNNKGILEENYQIIEMYFIRYIVWFLFFSIKNVDSETIKKEHKKIFEWLEKRFPNYKKNKLLRICKPKGEILSVRLTVYCFMLFHRWHLAGTILCLYSKI